MQITVVGAGYVGLSLATLLGQKHEVIVLDIDEEKVAKVNSRISPVQDVYQHFTVCCPWILYRSYFLKNGESERWNIKPKERCAIRLSLHQPDRPEQPHRGS